MISEQQQVQHQQDGYLVFDEYFADTDIDALKASALKIVDAFDGQSTRNFFSTKTDTFS